MNQGSTTELGVAFLLLWLTFCPNLFFSEAVAYAEWYYLSSNTF